MFRRRPLNICKKPACPTSYPGTTFNSAFWGTTSKKVDSIVREYFSYKLHHMIEIWLPVCLKLRKDTLVSEI